MSSRCLFRFMSNFDSIILSASPGTCRFLSAAPSRLYRRHASSLKALSPNDRAKPSNPETQVKSNVLNSLASEAIASITVY